MKKKCRDRKGFTLVEMMLAILLVLLFTEILTTGMSLATKTYARSVTNSEVQVLKATLTTAINNELRFAGKDENISTSSDSEEPIGDNILIDGKTFGTEFVEEGNNICLTYGFDGEGAFLVPPDAYPKGTQIGLFSISYDRDSNLFTVKLEITDGTRTIASNEFQVKNHADNT